MNSSKSLANGLPISAVPMAAAIETLRIVRRTDYLAHTVALGSIGFAFTESLAAVRSRIGKLEPHPIIAVMTASR